LKDKEVQISAAETKARELPEVPKEIQACLDKNACAAAKKDEVAKACKTADGIVLEQKKVIKELRSCGKTLLDWYGKVKAAEAESGGQKQAAAEATGHPRVAAPAKKRDADWP
jgi:DNA polymerase III delta subunit